MDKTDKNIIGVIGALVVVAFIIYVYNNTVINYNSKYALTHPLSASVLDSQYTVTPASPTNYTYSNYPTTSSYNYRYSGSATGSNTSTYYVPSYSTYTTTYYPSYTDTYYYPPQTYYNYNY